jgi:hypothetical protein
VCPKPAPLWPVRFALRWLLPLPCLQLQQPLLLLLPDRTLYRQLSFRCSLLLWSRRLLRLLLQLPQRLRLQRWLVLFRWLLSQLRWRCWQPLWRLQLWSSLWLPLPGLRLAFLQLLSIARALLACPKRLPLLQVRFALRWLLPLQYWRLQQPLLLRLPSRPLCRLSSLRWLPPLQLQM